MRWRRDPELLDCNPYLGAEGAMPEGHWPWVVLFARALGIRRPRRRRREILRLAAAYRELFPSTTLAPPSPPSSGLGP